MSVDPRITAATAAARERARGGADGGADDVLQPSHPAVGALVHGLLFHGGQFLGLGAHGLGVRLGFRCFS